MICSTIATSSLEFVAIVSVTFPTNRKESETVRTNSFKLKNEVPSDCFCALTSLNILPRPFQVPFRNGYRESRDFLALRDITIGL